MLAAFHAVLMNNAMINNATTSLMNNFNYRMKLMRKASNPKLGFSGIKKLHQQDMQLSANKLNSEMQYAANSAALEGNKKRLADSIDRSFGFNLDTYA